MNKILDHCEGVIGITDDVVAYGMNDKEHDQWLHKLIKVAQEYVFVFSGEKCTVKCNSVKFFGCVYEKDGIHPDPAKLSAMKEMLTPQSPTELYRHSPHTQKYGNC